MDYIILIIHDYNNYLKFQLNFLYIFTPIYYFTPSFATFKLEFVPDNL